MIPKLVAFDVDGTLAVSKQAIEPAMQELLGQLLLHTKVAIISGGKFEQLETQVARNIRGPESILDTFYILPTSGAALFEHRDGTWNQIYAKTIDLTEAEKITEAFEEAVLETGVLSDNPQLYGPQIEYRGNAAVAFSALGQMTPVDIKLAWDPTRQKRLALREAVAKRLPGFEVRVGGISTIDVTRTGIDKAFGMEELSKYLSISVNDMLYVGDALYPGGNDEAVKKTGISTKSVKDPSETADLIASLIDGSYDSSTSE